jgi:hypothetical protein
MAASMAADPLNEGKIGSAPVVALRMLFSFEVQNRQLPRSEWVAALHKSRLLRSESSEV